MKQAFQAIAIGLFFAILIVGGWQIERSVHYRWGYAAKVQQQLEPLQQQVNDLERRVTQLEQR